MSRRQRWRCCWRQSRYKSRRQRGYMSRRQRRCVGRRQRRYRSRPHCNLCGRTRGRRESWSAGWRCCRRQRWHMSRRQCRYMGRRQRRCFRRWSSRGRRWTGRSTTRRCCWEVRERRECGWYRRWPKRRHMRWSRCRRHGRHRHRHRAGIATNNPVQKLFRVFCFKTRGCVDSRGACICRDGLKKPENSSFAS